MAATHGAGLMDRLKNGTWDLHQAAENHPFQKSLLNGELPPTAYARYLAELARVHDALGRRLDETASGDPIRAAAARAHAIHTRNINADLPALGATDASPATATDALLALIRDASPAQLLGIHYVLEGSMNGNRFIAKVLEKRYNLTRERGLAYLDPYGDEQRATWLAFRAAMDAKSFSDDDEAAMLAAARATFLAIRDISQELAGETVSV